MTAHKNLFLVLGKYVERQNENLLTQSLAALFNHAPVFRNDLLALFARRSENNHMDVEGAFHAVTQSSQFLANSRILVDMEVRAGEDESPRYVLEAKLTAPLSPGQAQRYAQFLRQRRGRSQLVLITMSGVDTELKKLLPQRQTTWLTWTEIAEIAVRPAHRSKTERFLCDQFHAMLKERGVPMVPSITFGEYKKLKLLNRFVESKNLESLHRDNIGTINNVMARMQIFTDASWSNLTDVGYKPYARLFAIRPSKGDDFKKPYAEISSGFYHVRNGRHIHERHVYLGLDCDDMRLYVWGGWVLGKKHSEHAAESWGTCLKDWTLPQSRLLFKKPLPIAQKEIQIQLEKCLRRFKTSRYFKA